MFYRPVETYLACEGHFFSCSGSDCLWFFDNLWCICSEDDDDHNDDDLNDDEDHYAHDEDHDAICEDEDQDDEDDNDCPTCNIDDNAGFVVSLCIGRRARHLFSCVAPVIIIIIS